MTLYSIKASFVDWVNCIEHLSHLVHTPCGIRNWCRASNSISADNYVVKIKQIDVGLLLSY